LNPYGSNPASTSSGEKQREPAQRVVSDAQDATAAPAMTRAGDSPGTVCGDVVEAALAEALRRASDAGQWAVVAQLARELEARRLAAAGVIDLVGARRRRARKQT
jgi:hypothetical protein